MKIRLDKDTHIYTVDGRQLPSVSAIMRPLSEDHYKDVPNKYMLVAQQRGIEIHDAIETYLMFDIMPTVWEDYLKSFKAWMDYTGFELIKTEMMLTNGVYCGTIDLYGRLHGRYVLVDIKTTSTKNTKLLEVQLQAYKDLLVANGYQVDDLYYLGLFKTGYDFSMITGNVEKWRELLSEYEDQSGQHHQTDQENGA